MFLANMSHEFRTPLNSVIGYTDLMCQSETDPVKQEQLKIIRSSSQSLLVLLNDILDLSKIEAGKLEIIYQPVDVAKTIDEVFQLFKLNTDKKGIKFTYSVQNGFPESIIFSEIRLRQILFNLVGNAVKFTEKGEVLIEAMFEEKKDGTLDMFIDIEDTGSGIKKDDLDLIFKPFVQLAGNSNNHGTGLGLTITKRLIESLGGKLTVNSEVGKGTCFVIKFYNVKKVEPEFMQKQNDKQAGDHSKNNIKTLFLCSDDTDFAEEYRVMNSLTNSVVKVENDLSIAKSVMNETALTVVCSDKAEFINNAVKVLSQITTAKNQWFIITTNNNKIKSDGLANSYRVIDRTPETLKAAFYDLSFDIMASEEFADLISCYEQMKDNKEFIADLEKELLPVFDLAVKSKLMGNIKEFSALLKQYGRKYHIDSFNKFADLLDINIQKFEISEVERLLNYFENYCFINRVK
jgi:anti-sigma regulatory factor (Ser/Thr protein kinase)